MVIAKELTYRLALPLPLQVSIRLAQRRDPLLSFLEKESHGMEGGELQESLDLSE